MSIKGFSTSVLFQPAQIQDAPKDGYGTAATLPYLLRRLLGCWHRKMTRPFTRGDRTYRTCSRCGMRRDFDLKTWKMKGRYYREPVVASLISTADSSAEISKSVASHDCQTSKLHLLQ